MERVWVWGFGSVGGIFLIYAHTPIRFGSAQACHRKGIRFFRYPHLERALDA